jgi:hypothetical protein
MLENNFKFLPKFHVMCLNEYAFSVYDTIIKNQEIRLSTDYIHE